SGRASRPRRCSSCRAGVPLLLGLVDELAALHRRVVSELLSDLLELLRASPEVLGLSTELFTGDVAALRRVQEHDDGTRQRSDDETHSCSPLSFRAKTLPLRVAFRDGNGCSRDARRVDRQPLLGVLKQPEPYAGLVL